MRANDILDGLEEYSKYELPGNVVVDIRDYMGRYGRVKLVSENGQLLLVSDDRALIAEVISHRRVGPYIQAQSDENTLLIVPGMRGHLKQALVHIGYPVEDLAGYVSGAPLTISLRSENGDGEIFSLRGYQSEAADVFYAGGALHGGSGTIVLPCGAGKTVVGMAVMERLQSSTLILTPSTVSVRQWIEELLDKTSLSRDEIGEYSGISKEIRPVTISTYQVMTYRNRREGSDEEFSHGTRLGREVASDGGQCVRGGAKRKAGGRSVQCA